MHWCFFRSLSPSFPLCLKINKILIRNSWICCVTACSITCSSSWMEALLSCWILGNFWSRREALTFPTPGICCTVQSRDGSEIRAYFFMRKGFLLGSLVCSWSNWIMRQESYIWLAIGSNTIPRFTSVWLGSTVHSSVLFSTTSPWRLLEFLMWTSLFW